ncbi:hypothetical protein HK101_003006, partial [Irineochytrium annulatum]
VVKPLRPPLYPPLYPAPYLPASKSAPKPSYFHSLTEKPARSRPTPKQRKKVRGVATRLTSLLLAYGIEIIFCYFWVLGLARPTTHPYLRDNSVGTVFYAIAMVGFNILGLVILAFWLVMDLDLPLWRPTCGGNIAVILAVLVFVSGHIGAPFIATTVVQVLDFGNACYGSSWAFGTDGGGGVTLGGLTVGQSTLMDVDGDHIVASFKADAMALRASTNAGLWRNGTGLVDVEIVLDRGGKGNITGSCLPVGESGTTTPVPCMTGLLTARVDTALTGWFAPTTTSGTVTPGNRTLIAFGYPDWWDNPLDVTGGSDSEPSVALANTAAKPYSDQVKVCSNREDVAFVVMAVVNQLQGRASGCNDCWTHCTNCCREYCYEVTSTVAIPTRALEPSRLNRMNQNFPGLDASVMGHGHRAVGGGFVQPRGHHLATTTAAATPPHVPVTATIIRIVNRSSFSYPSCPRCAKKVIETVGAPAPMQARSALGDVSNRSKPPRTRACTSAWRCDRCLCDWAPSDVVHRYHVTMLVSVDAGIGGARSLRRVTAFGDSLNPLFGHSATGLQHAMAAAATTPSPMERAGMTRRIITALDRIATGLTVRLILPFKHFEPAICMVLRREAAERTAEDELGGLGARLSALFLSVDANAKQGKGAIRRCKSVKKRKFVLKEIARGKTTREVPELVADKVLFPFPMRMTVVDLVFARDAEDTENRLSIDMADRQKDKFAFEQSQPPATPASSVNDLFGSLSLGSPSSPINSRLSHSTPQADPDENPFLEMEAISPHGFFSIPSPRKRPFIFSPLGSSNRQPNSPQTILTSTQRSPAVLVQATLSPSTLVPASISPSSAFSHRRSRPETPQKRPPMTPTSPLRFFNLHLGQLDTPQKRAWKPDILSADTPQSERCATLVESTPPPTPVVLVPSTPSEGVFASGVGVCVPDSASHGTTRGSAGFVCVPNSGRHSGRKVWADDEEEGEDEEDDGGRGGRSTPTPSPLTQKGTPWEGRQSLWNGRGDEITSPSPSTVISPTARGFGTVISSSVRSTDTVISPTVQGVGSVRSPESVVAATMRSTGTVLSPTSRGTDEVLTQRTVKQSDFARTRSGQSWTSSTIVSPTPRDHGGAVLAPASPSVASEDDDFIPATQRSCARPVDDDDVGSVVPRTQWNSPHSQGDRDRDGVMWLTSSQLLWVGRRGVAEQCEKEFGSVDELLEDLAMGEDDFEEVEDDDEVVEPTCEDLSSLSSGDMMVEVSGVQAMLDGLSMEDSDDELGLVDSSERARASFVGAYSLSSLDDHVVNKRRGAVESFSSFDDEMVTKRRGEVDTLPSLDDEMLTKRLGAAISLPSLEDDMVNKRRGRNGVSGGKVRRESVWWGDDEEEERMNAALRELAY